MTRTVLESILSAAEGVKALDDGFEVDPGHRLSFYIGQPGQAMVLNEVVRGRLHESYVMVTVSEKNTSVFVEYDALHAVSSTPPRDDATRRAGFA